MSEQFAALLGAVLEAPDSELDYPDIVGPRERRLLTEAFRGPVVSVPELRWPVHLAIADLARTDPARPAIGAGVTTRTPSELDARAPAVAERLLGAGGTVGP